MGQHTSILSSSNIMGQHAEVFCNCQICSWDNVLTQHRSCLVTWGNNIDMLLQLSTNMMGQDTAIQWELYHAVHCQCHCHWFSLHCTWPCWCRNREGGSRHSSSVPALSDLIKVSCCISAFTAVVQWLCLVITFPQPVACQGHAGSPRQKSAPSGSCWAASAVPHWHSLHSHGSCTPAHRTQPISITVLCITFLLQSQLRLPIPQRMQRKINTPSYKCIIGTAPSYVCDCLQLYTPSHTLCFALDTLSLQIPRIRLSTVGSCNFCLRPLYMWNDLPLPLWTPLDPASNYYFSLKNRPAFPSHCCFPLPQAQFIICKLCIQCVRVHVCVC